MSVIGASGDGRTAERIWEWLMARLDGRAGPGAATAGARMVVQHALARREAACREATRAERIGPHAVLGKASPRAHPCRHGRSHPLAQPLPVPRLADAGRAGFTRRPFPRWPRSPPAVAAGDRRRLRPFHDRPTDAGRPRATAHG